MANTKIPSELSSTPSISDSGDATAIVIDSSERVGIKKTPTKELDVAGTIKAVGATNNNTMEVFGAETSNQSFGLLVNAGTSSSDYSALFRDENANTVLKIQGDGNVGINTSSPTTAKVVIAHDNSTIALHTTGGYNYQAKFESTDAEAAIVLADSNSTGNYNRIGVITNDLVFISNNSERMRIDSTGRFGLGTATPSVGFFEVAQTYNGRVGYFNQVGSGGSNHGVMIDCASTSGWAFQTRTNGNTQLGVTGSVVYVNDQLGVGTSSPHSSRLLELKTSTNHYYPYQHVTGSSTYYMGFGNSSYHHHFESGASVGFYWGSAGYFNGGAHTYSDERLKENITTIDGALDKVALMNGVTFDWIDQDLRGSGKQFGVTAQNMLEVDAELPKLVEDAEASQEDIDNEEIDTQYYAMDYARLTPFFIEAIKELKTKLEAAEARITELEG